MARIKTNFQVTQQLHQLLKPNYSSGLLDNSRQSQLLFDVTRSNSFWRWFKKKPPETCEPVNLISINPCDVEKCVQTLYKSSCRKRIPECPEYICCGGIRCDDGTSRKRTWFSFKKPPPKVEPVHNCPPEECRHQTFREYIFGNDEPLPDPETCRRVYKQRQEIMENDCRLNDPRYRATEGDVLIYSDYPRFQYDYTFETKPTPPPLFRLPASVICKKVSDSVSCMDCYCACVEIPQEPCQANLCPAHQRPYKLPYEEMKPRNRRVQYLEHKQQCCWHPCKGDPCVDPSKREVCECSNYPAPKTPCYGFMCTSEDCTLNEAVQKTKAKLLCKQQLEDHLAGKKMSRGERLKKMTQNTDVSVCLPEFSPKNPLALPQNRCNPCPNDCTLPNY